MKIASQAGQLGIESHELSLEEPEADTIDDDVFDDSEPLTVAT